MKRKHLTCPVTDVKTLEDQGVIEAIVNVFGIVDHGGDRVCLGAFADSLARRKPYGCLHHDWTRPVARTLEARELAPGDPLLPPSIRDYGGLYVKGRFNLETQDGREAYSNIKAGILDQFSIGYAPEEERRARDGANELVRATLYEWSPVLWGMNPATAVLSVKSGAPPTPERAKSRYLGEYAEEEMTLAALRDACDSLFYRAIYTILFSHDGVDRTTEEKVAEIDAAIMEFHALCVRALGAMLAALAGDEDARAEMEAQYKQLFPEPGPALTAARFDQQLLRLLTDAENCIPRAESIRALRMEQGRSPFSRERHEQLRAVYRAWGALVEKTAPRTALDVTLLELKMKSRSRALALVGAIGEN